MEDQKKNPVEDSSSVTQPQTPVEQPVKLPLVKSQKVRKTVLLTLLFSALVLAGAAGAYFWLASSRVVSPSVDAPVVEKPVVNQQNTRLLFATKVGTAGGVYQLMGDASPSEEVAFTESFAYNPDSGNVWEMGAPSASLSTDGQKLVYVSNNNLVVRDMASNEETTVVRATTSAKATYGLPEVTLDPALPVTGGPKGIFTLSSPVWSRDGQKVGFHVGHYEGNSMHVIDTTTKKYLSLGDTFRYISEKGVPATKFTLLADTKPLAGLGISGEYLVDEYKDLINPTLSVDGVTLVAILCPLDLPNSGNSKYLESSLSALELADAKRQRDCGETGDRTLIVISTSDGTYREITKGTFGTTLAVDSAGSVYVSGGVGNNYVVTKTTLSGTGTSEQIDVKALSKLAPGDTVEGVSLRSATDVPVAEVFVKNAETRVVKVIDLKKKELVGTVSLVSKEGYVTLGVLY